MKKIIKNLDTKIDNINSFEFNKFNNLENGVIENPYNNKYEDLSNNKDDEFEYYCDLIIHGSHGQVIDLGRITKEEYDYFSNNQLFHTGIEEKLNNLVLILDKKEVLISKNIVDNNVIEVRVRKTKKIIINY